MHLPICERNCRPLWLQEIASLAAFLGEAEGKDAEGRRGGEGLEVLQSSACYWDHFLFGREAYNTEKYAKRK